MTQNSTPAGATHAPMTITRYKFNARLESSLQIQSLLTTKSACSLMFWPVAITRRD